MGDNFVFKKTNFVSLLENDRTKNAQFYRWFPFLNEHSIARFALTAETQLNIDMLRYTRQNAYDSINGANLGIEFYVSDEAIRVPEDDLNDFLQLPRNEFIDPPDETKVFNFSEEFELHCKEIIFQENYTK